MKPLITVLTPTYNRGELLNRVFEGLQQQTNKDFEWIIVDDGSTDNTKSIIDHLKSKSFPIRYYYKDNGGKHTALNVGVKKARGKFILMLDSDDVLPKDAIEIVIKKLNNLPTHLGGIVGRKMDFNHNLIGSPLNFKDIMSNSLDIRYKHHVTGDLTEIFKKEVFEKYPFPVFVDERFCPEALVWNRIAQDYDLLFFDKPIYIADYQSDGLTSSIIKIRMNSPKATMTHYSELGSYNIPLKEKIKTHINFWRFSFNNKDWSFKRKCKMVNNCYTPFCLPLGFAMHLNDKRKTA